MGLHDNIFLVKLVLSTIGNQRILVRNDISILDRFPYLFLELDLLGHRYEEANK